MSDYTTRRAACGCEQRGDRIDHIVGVCRGVPTLNDAGEWVRVVVPVITPRHDDSFGQKPSEPLR